MLGFLVYCGSDAEGEFFGDAASAMRYAEFMAELGYDALYFNAKMTDSGSVVREERVPEQFMRACLALGL